MIPEVAHTGDFQRILDLPRRVWDEGDLTQLAADLTTILRTPGGSMRLRPVQALALHDAGIYNGLFGPIGVGEGKTLITLLLSLVLKARRPLLLLPAALIEKTQRDRLALSRHWKIPNTLRCFSYDMLGRVQAASELETYQPDVIICDEVHRLKNRRAAVTRRVARYMMAQPHTKFCGLSGTVMSKSIKDFAHILRWCLKTEAPIPLTNEETEEWAEALDQSVDPCLRRGPGALFEFCSAGENEREGFRRRLTETPGVVATIGEGESVGASIYVRAITPTVAPVTEQNFRKLREEWATPDDWALMYATDIYRHSQELALGLFYAWNPRPPQEWRDARKAWHQFVRATISNGRTFDSELHVANAVDAGRLPLGREVLAAWRTIGPTFRPNVIPVWCDDSAIRACAEWMSRPGLVWTEHGFFAQRLSKLTGASYYAQGGFDARGRYIEDADPDAPAIASIDANREGKNLQKIWHRNLFVCPPASAEWWEQAIARTHRTGQEADEVTLDVLLGCRENFDNCIKAIEGARAIYETTGKKQKLLMADILLPSEAEIDALRTPRWVK